MHKRTKLIVFLAILSFVLLLVVVAAGAYYYGLQHQKAEVQVLTNENAVLKNDVIRAQEKTRTEVNRSLNDYNSACAEYQKLYAAYDALYQKTDGSGQVRYTSPDAARGNEESCYR